MRVRAALAFLLAVGCGNGAPQIRYYRLSPPQVEVEDARPVGAGCEPGARPTLAIEELQVDAVYDDPRIVYRESEYELEYYNYHEWSAPPGQLVTDALRAAFGSTGLFGRIERDWSSEAAAVLRGRVHALEEVDRSSTRWDGRLALDLELVDERTDTRLWSDAFEIVRRLPERSPEGLAAATSAAVAEIVAESAPEIAAALRSQQVDCTAQRQTSPFTSHRSAGGVVGVAPAPQVASPRP